MALNIQTLNEKQIDFYNFSIEKYNLFYCKTLKEIASIYGCGMSFIYNFFKKLNIKGLKNYISELNGIIYTKKSFTNKMFDLNIKEKFQNSLFINFEQQIEQIKNIEIQENKIVLIKKILKNSNYIYGIGFGHSKLAIKDILSFFEFLNPNTIFLNYDKNIDIKHFVNQKSVIIIYSVRLVNKKYLTIIKELKKIENIKIILVTSNRNIDEELFEIVFYVNNPMKYQDFFNMNIYIGPLNTFLMFNNYLKSSIYLDNKEFLLKNKKFVKETIGWVDYKEAVDL
ncbi:hypothetical protein [Spiroplasma tabanidicola]|uniref:MurR/RpiR family transcriptional regulator n=1 Tax=Spiroplasma tabanidicola TaxID=324079 RepID=A0A6I6CBF9_9MOLU|nr:hypothetical protein [Spiroplasma tabanidicola]QGS52281.1 hypothetical protein STABA_v1c09280 [Spiroplasma tabanidicola]